MTKQDAKRATLRWLDEATVNGSDISPEQNADYLERMNYLLAPAVDFFAGQFPLPARYTAVQNPVRNLLGGGYNTQQVLPAAPFKASAKNAQSFYLELEGVCTVKITAGGTVLFEENIVSEGKFTPVFANFPTQHSFDAEITVRAHYPAAVRAIALYPCRFSGGEVQPYTRYTAYQMPSDFKELVNIVHTYNGCEYEDYAPYKRESGACILLPREQAGQFDFIYHRTPQRISPIAKDETVLDVDPRAETLLPLKLAVDLTAGLGETAALSSFLEGHFAAMLASVAGAERPARAEIQTLFYAN